MEKKQIIVNNVPDCGDETLTNYLEVVCDNGVEDISRVDDRIRHIALVTLEEDIEDITDYSTKVQQKLLEGKMIELTAVAPPGGLFVQHVPADCTEDTLKFYFQSSRSGGRDEAVKKCEINRRHQVALVHITDETAMEGILKQSKHVPCKNKPPVYVQPYHSNYHDKVLASLNNLLEETEVSSEGNNSISDDNDDDEASFVECDEMTEEEWSFGLSREQSYESTELTDSDISFHLEGEEFGTVTQDASPNMAWDDSPTAPQTNDSNSAEEFDSDQFMMKQPPQKPASKTKPNQVPIGGEPHSQAVAVGLRKSEKQPPPKPAPKPKPNPVTIGGERHSQTVTGGLRKLEKQPPPKPAPKPKPNPVTIGGERHSQTVTRGLRKLEKQGPPGAAPTPRSRYIPHQQESSTEVKKLFPAKPAPEPKPRNDFDTEVGNQEDPFREDSPEAIMVSLPMFQPEPKLIECSVTFPVANVRLLESSQVVAKEFPTCSFKYMYFPDKGTINVHGPEAEMQNVMLSLYEKNHEIASDTTPIPKSIATMLRAERGKQFLDNELKTYTNTCWYLEGDSFACVYLKKSDGFKIMTHVKGLITQEYLEFNSSHEAYMTGLEWSQKIDQMENTYMVKISPQDGSRLRLDALDGTDKKVKQELADLLKKHSSVSKTFSVSGTKAKCFKTNFQDDIQKIKQNFSSANGKWEENWNLVSPVIKLEGSPELVHSTERDLQQLLQRVWHEKLFLRGNVAKDKDLNLLRRGLQKDMQVMQLGFEIKHSCFLEWKFEGVKTDRPPMVSSKSVPNFERPMRRVQSAWSLDEERVPELSIWDEPNFSLRSSPRSSPRPSQRSSLRSLSESVEPPTFAEPRYSPPDSRTLGNIKLSIKQGDICQVQVDVIVNVVPSSLDLRGTTVSQSITKAGGQQFEQEFQRFQSLAQTSDIIAMDGCGRLQAKRVYTVSLDKWNPNSSKTDLEGVIDRCLKRADAEKATSVIFPPLGCGRLFKFPTNSVSSAFVNAVQANSGLRNLKDVSITIFDGPTYQAFLRDLNPGHTAYFQPSFLQSPYRSRDVRPKSRVQAASWGNVTIKQGDITREKATVLVNVIASNLDMNSTLLSQLFAKAGGDQFVQQFETQKSAQTVKNIIVTPGEQLNCSYVYTVVLKEWTQTNSTEFSQIVRDCFLLAKKYNSASIALPGALGCGRRLKYPSHVVGSTLITEAIASKIPVMLVVHDENMCLEFQEHLRQETYDHYETEDVEALRSLAKSSRAGREPCKEAKSACVVIYAADKKKCLDARSSLVTQLKSDYLHAETIEIERSLHLSKHMLAEINKCVGQHRISIKFPDPDKKKRSKLEIKLKGEKTAVHKVKSEVLTILLSKKSHSEKQHRAKHPRGSPGFLNEMGIKNSFDPPSYWQISNKLTQIKSFLFGRGKHNPRVTLDPKSAVYQAVDSLVLKTWNSGLVGNGRDALGLSHKNIQVKQIERFEEPNLFTRYCQKRATKFSLAFQSGKPFQSVDKLPGSKGQVVTTVNAANELKQDVYPEVNEHYFFHGTSQDKLEAILETGLDNRIGNTNAMFGLGIYGAESSTKADQYADSTTSRTRGPKMMVLMRMTLGHPYVCKTADKTTKFRRPPCKDLQCLKDNCTKKHGIFDSVIGDGQWLFREFVVYDSDLCYPEYIITYNRL